jgi:hypothetical protein
MIDGILGACIVPCGVSLNHFCCFTSNQHGRTNAKLQKNDPHKTPMARRKTIYIPNKPSMLQSSQGNENAKQKVAS